MTYDQLEMLEAIVERGSFKLAAESLHKSQPSLSMGIKKLEEEFSLTLFNRDEYRPKLTEQGRIFYNWARETLATFRHLQVIGKEMGQGEFEPKLTIVLDPLVPMETLSPLFNHCLGPQSPTELTLRTEVGRGSSLLLSGEANLAIATREKNDDQLESVPFLEVELIPVIHKSIAADYRKYPQVVVTAPVSPSELSKGPKCFVSDHAMKGQVIRQGHGWGRLARHEIERELKAKTLIRLPDPKVRPFTITLFLMRHKYKGQGPMARSVWKAFQTGR